MHNDNHDMSYSNLLTHRPQATAKIRGSAAYPTINGMTRFYQTARGVLVVTEMMGLPQGNGCNSPIFGFHIHEGGACAGNANDPFAATRTHFNPRSCPHPYHAGDLPPLFGSNGIAFSAVLTDRFTVNDVLGKTVVLHDSPDDFTTQPAGNSGTKIACGVIVKQA